MKITIFGATGRTGIPLVEQALSAGHDVVAYVRTPSKLPVHNERLTIMQGEMNESAKVAAAIAGSDAVISALGPVKGGPKDIMAASARNIVAAMDQAGVRRLVYATGAGVEDPQDKPALMNKIISFALKTLNPDVLADSAAGVNIVRNSDLDWTIARGPMLTDGPHTGKYRVGYVNGDMGRQLSRANFADYMLKSAVEGLNNREMPAISDLK
jgi:putative NADH-flavin reductase